ncbi:hypothetical protein D3C79_704010 [compost metagenome]
MRRQHQFDAAVQRTAFKAVVGCTRHFRAHAAQHQAIALQAAEAEDGGYRLGALLAELGVGCGDTTGVGMAKHQYRGLLVGLDGLGHTGDRAEGDRQKHGRTIRVVGAVDRYGNYQHVFTALDFELAVLDGFAQLRLIAVQPGLGGFVVDFRHGSDLALVTLAKRPPPAAGAFRLGVGLGHFFGYHVLNFLVDDLVRAKWPPVETGISGPVFLRMLRAAGDSQAQGES